MRVDADDDGTPGPARRGGRYELLGGDLPASSTMQRLGFNGSDGPSRGGVGQ